MGHRTWADETDERDDSSFAGRAVEGHRTDRLGEEKAAHDQRDDSGQLGRRQKDLRARPPPDSEKSRKRRLREHPIPWAIHS